MENTEYEYSFKVESLDSYIEYCRKNNYDKVEENKQTRILYRNKNKTMARVTKKEENELVKLFLDFKDDILNDEVLVERKESLPLEFNDEEAVESILKFLEYEKDTILVRTRTVYKKGNVEFEIDDYKSPEKMYVVAIEGKKEDVDEVYNEIKKINN